MCLKIDLIQYDSVQRKNLLRNNYTKNVNMNAEGTWFPNLLA